MEMGFVTIIIVIACIIVFLYARYKKQQIILAIVDEARIKQQAALEQKLADSTKKVEDARKDYQSSLDAYNAKYGRGKPGDGGFNGH